ncbi:MAG TPA: DUF378 domain-containing protein [Thermoguttaceae bacterium]|nr:DUF378 domain-containing protein [Thermoguttaceae bacterium]
MQEIHPLAVIGISLLILGGLNLGLIGLVEFDLIGYLFGVTGVVTRIIYVLVGLSAIGVGLWLPVAGCGCDYSTLFERKKPTSTP